MQQINYREGKSAAAIMLNYEIIFNLISIQVRDPFFSRPIFLNLMIRNAIKLLFAFYDHSNFPKLQNIGGRHYGKLLNWP
jgi:hypothetical protein